MKASLEPGRWLRQRHRGAKFAILLVAAWAPLVFPHRPLLAGALMLSATAIFLITTHFGRSEVAAEPSPHDLA